MALVLLAGTASLLLASFSTRTEALLLMAGGAGALLLLAPQLRAGANDRFWPRLVVVAFPAPILALFCTEFTRGTTMQATIAIGRYGNVVTGCVGMLLMMMMMWGHKRTMRNIMAVSAAAIAGLNVLLVPPLGALWAALALAYGLILQNVIGAVAVWRLLGIRLLGAWEARGG